MLDNDYDTWRVGQRVRRKDSEEHGTVVVIDKQIKVKWDGGGTSYFERDKPGNVRSVDRTSN